MAALVRRSAVIGVVTLVGAAACSDDEGGADGGASGESAGGSQAASAGGAQPLAGGAQPLAGGAAEAVGGGAEGGAGGAPPVSSGPRTLGARCSTTPDCKPGLTCISATDRLLDDAAPPKGLCTAICEADSDCTRLHANSLCGDFDTDFNSRYCVEGCSFGQPAVGQAKCHGRPELSCKPARLEYTSVRCETIADCELGLLCEGNCAYWTPACMPACRGDLDCAPGLHCDPWSGTCGLNKSTGKRVGEPCKVMDEPDDECLGFCLPDADSEVNGHCTTTCGLGSGCEWDDASEKFDGACLDSTVLARNSVATGDFGFCTPTCDCSDECSAPNVSCSVVPNHVLGSDYRRAGLCVPPDESTEPHEQCSGAGGVGASGAGGAN